MRTSSGVTSPVYVRAVDGVALAITHTARSGAGEGPSDLAIVLVPGFSEWSRKPGVARATAVFAETADVFQVDLRGHGRSGGLSTLSDREVFDVDAAVAYARSLGFAKVVAVGFSMGGSAVIRHAALAGDTLHGVAITHPVEAVVSISSGSAWYIRETKPMRRLHWLVLTRLGRLVARRVFKVRINPDGWGDDPLSPTEAVARLRIPLLIVHGDEDPYLLEKHAHALYEAAGGVAAGKAQLWLERGFGHAEEAASPELLRRIGAALPALATGPASAGVNGG